MKSLNYAVTFVVSLTIGTQSVLADNVCNNVRAPEYFVNRKIHGKTTRVSMILHGDHMYEFVVPTSRIDYSVRYFFFNNRPYRCMSKTNIFEPVINQLEYSYLGENG
jgi:hypothetical protein